MIPANETLSDRKGSNAVVLDLAGPQVSVCMYVCMYTRGWVSTVWSESRCGCPFMIDLNTTSSHHPIAPTNIRCRGTAT